MAEMKGIKLCGECGNYDYKKHRCKIGCMDDSNAQASFYGDCPLPDVVPKSEYDAVVSAVDNSTKEFLKLHDDYQEAKREIDEWKGRSIDWHEVACLKSQRILELEAELSKAKAEVAGEIFEEIENIAKTVGYPETLVNGMIKNNVLDGMYLEREDFDNLKKKYTEEKS